MIKELATVYDNCVKERATEILSRFDPNETTYNNDFNLFKPYGQSDYFPATPDDGERDSRDGFISFNSGNVFISGHIDVLNAIQQGHSFDGAIGARIGMLESNALKDYIAKGNDPDDDDEWYNFLNEWLIDSDIDFKVEIALLDSGELHLRMGIIAMGTDGYNPSYDYVIDEMMEIGKDTEHEKISEFLDSAEHALNAYSI